MNLYSTGPDQDAKALFLFGSDGGSYDRESGMKVLREVFAGAGWETNRLLDDLGTADDFYFDTVSQVQLDTYSSGRVCLVGDAAYCPSFASGQGSTLALVGAYLLAGELARADRASAGHASAFAAYERLMRPYAERNLKLGRDNLNRMVAKSAFQSRLGALVMRILPHLPGKDRLVARMTQPIHDASRAIDLPQY